MPSTFPTTYDTWADVADDVHDILADHVNNANNGMIAVQQKVGLDSDAQGSATDEGRLKELEARAGGARGTSTASAASLTLPTDGHIIPITGTTTITSIGTSGWGGKIVVLEVAAACQLTDDGSALDLAGDFVGPGQLLLECTGSAWKEVARSTSTALTNPMTAEDDLVIGGTAGAPARLSRGTDGQVLTVDPTTHHLVWAPSAAGFANPMVAADDLIVGGVAGTATRLAKGAAGQVLTVDPGTLALVWADSTALANPMTTAGDVIVGDTGGTPARLAKGASGQVLTVHPSSGLVVWANSQSGFANPMVAAGDLIVGGTSGTAQRLAAGSDGQVLKLVSGAPAWAAESGGGGGGASGFETRLGSVVVPPTSWTWLNQGSAAITSESYGERLALPADGSTSFHVRYIAAPTPPYTLTACLFLDALGAATTTGVLIWGDNSDLLETYGLYAESSGIALRGQRWSSPTAFGGEDVVYNWAEHILWLELEDDGTNRKVRVSHTGEAGTFIEVLSKGRTGHLTPTRLGWGGSVATSKIATAFLLSWEVL